MAQRSHKRHSAVQWQGLIDQQAASGASQIAFCAEQGLALSTFQYWKRRLKAMPRGDDGKSSPLFTPLHRPAASTDIRSECGPASGWSLELDLGDGVCLRLSRTP